MSNEKQAQELTGNEWEVLSAPATHKTEATQYAIMRREGLVCGFTANNSDTEAPERAALIASAPSLKAENERLRKALKGMITWAETTAMYHLHQDTELLPKGFEKWKELAGEGRHGV